MARTRTKRPEVSIEQGTKLVASAEQRYSRAKVALEAAEEEATQAQRALNVARRDLHDANRREIEAAKS